MLRLVYNADTDPRRKVRNKWGLKREFYESRHDAVDEIGDDGLELPPVSKHSFSEHS